MILTLPAHVISPSQNAHGGLSSPQGILSLIEMELWDKDQTNPWDQTTKRNVLSPTVPELTSLGHMMTPSGRVKVKRNALRVERFFANNFRAKKDSGLISESLCFSLPDASNHIFSNLGRSAVKLKICPQVKVTRILT